MTVTGVVVLVVALAVASVAGLLLRRRDGRARVGGGASGGWDLAGTVPSPGDRALLLQLSSPVCAPCRQTAALLGGLAEQVPGLVHVEVDVAERVDVARRLGVLRTPTVVAFDARGTELARLSGVPRIAELEAALAPAIRIPRLPSGP